MQVLKSNAVLLEEDVFKLSLKDGVQLVQQASNEIYISNKSGYSHRFDGIPPSVSDALHLLDGEFLSKNELSKKVFNGGGLGELTQFLYHLEKLERGGFLLYTVFSNSSACFSYENMTGAVKFGIERLLHKKFKFSRFSYIRNEGNYFIIESSLGTARIKIYNDFIFRILNSLSNFNTIEDLLEETGGENEQVLIGFLAALNIGQYLEIEEDKSEISIYDFWSFHEIMFHTRSRFGRQNYNVGATFRFMGKKACKKPEANVYNALKEIPLNIPSKEEIRASKNLFECMNERHSSRNFAGFDLDTLGKFLYRCLYIKNRKDYQVFSPDNKTDTMELLSAPYPSGGSIYELSFYLTVHECDGLEPGFYQYNPFEHKLFLLQHPNHHTATMMFIAKACMVQTENPPVLLTYAADFERMFWKYENMAYAAIMKNVGAVYQTMYLVATDMGIGACALGNANIETFQNLKQKSFLQESSVGEFVLGWPKKN